VKPVAAMFDNHFKIESSRLLSFSQLAELAKHPQQKPKAEAYAIAPQLSGSKAKADVVAFDKMSMLWVDIDEGNRALIDIKNQLENLPIKSFIIYATASSTKEAKKWRVLIKIDKPLICIAWVQTQEALQILMQGDTAATRVQQILYAPNKGKHYEYLINDGQPLSSTPKALQSVIDDLKAKRAAIHEQIKTALKPPPVNGKFSIQDINDSMDVIEVLKGFDYKRQGRKWLSPNSSSGIAGVIAFNDGRWFSNHASDSDIGLKINGGTCGDCFDLVTHYEYAGDKIKAYAKLACLLDDSNKQRRFEYMKAKGAAS